MVFNQAKKDLKFGTESFGKMVQCRLELALAEKSALFLWLLVAVKVKIMTMVKVCFRLPNSIDLYL